LAEARPEDFDVYRLVRWNVPHKIEWHADDGRDEITITYEVRALSPTLTRFAQHDDLRLGARRALHPLMRVGIRHDIAGQLRRLRRILEARDPR
jgi:hypothetical protein